jgi:hypothetical protein
VHGAAGDPGVKKYLRAKKRVNQPNYTLKIHHQPDPGNDLEAGIG